MIRGVHVDMATLDKGLVTATRHRWLAVDDSHGDHGLLVRSVLFVFDGRGLRSTSDVPHVDLVYTWGTFRRQGLASALYRQASSFMDCRVGTNGCLTREGQAWAKHVNIPGRTLKARWDPGNAERAGLRELFAMQNLIHDDHELWATGKDIDASPQLRAENPARRVPVVDE